MLALGNVWLQTLHQPTRDREKVPRVIRSANRHVLLEFVSLFIGSFFHFAGKAAPGSSSGDLQTSSEEWCQKSICCQRHRCCFLVSQTRPSYLCLPISSSSSPWASFFCVTQVLCWHIRVISERHGMSSPRSERPRRRSVMSGWISHTSTWSRSSTSVLCRWWENKPTAGKLLWPGRICYSQPVSLSPVWKLLEEILQISEHGGVAVSGPSALQVWQAAGVQTDSSQGGKIFFLLYSASLWTANN